MSKIKTTPFDAADYLKTPGQMAAYLEATFEESGGDAAAIAHALGDIARAQGMTKVARDAGLSRESLYKWAAGERSPDFETILEVGGGVGREVDDGAKPRSTACRPTGR